MLYHRNRVVAFVSIILCLPHLGLSVIQDDTDWPMWGYDATRAGVTPMQLPTADELHLHWVRELGPPRRAWPAQGDDFDKLEFDRSYAPVVMGDTLFVGSMVDDRLTAYAIDTGEEQWRAYVDGPIRLAPTAWRANVYCVSDDGYLYCFDAETGELNWRFRAAPSEKRVLGNERVISMWPARGAPVVMDGTVYFAAGIWPFQGIFVYALNAETGEVVWANTGEGTTWQAQPHGGAYAFAGLAPQGYLAASGDRLVVSGGRTSPALFDRRTGRLIHTNITGKGVPGRPSGGYRVETDGEYYYNHGDRYRLRDGGGRSHPHSLRNETLDGLVNELRGAFDGDVFTSLAARGRIFVVTVNGTLYCFGTDERDPCVYKHSPQPPDASDDEVGRRAASLLEQSESAAGYALFLGVGEGDLIEQVAVRSNLHIVGVDPDAEKIRTLRRRFDDVGLYGTRISLLHDSPREIDYPPYISSLVVVQDPDVIGADPDPDTLEKVLSLLHPYNGKAFVSGRDEDRLLLAREGGLPDTGRWTHQYADSANTVFSDDDRVRLPLGILWFGGPSNENVLPRHGHGPIPHVVSGVMVLPGVETLSGRCVYTGRTLWERSFPGIGHPFTDLGMEDRYSRGQSVFMHDRNGLGAHYIGSPYVSMPDGIYVRYRSEVFRLDPQTGATLAQFKLLGDRDTRGSVDWGHISVWEDLLIATVDPHVFRNEEVGSRFQSMADIKGRDWSATSSRTLLVLDRYSGELLWSREAEIGFRHNAIVTAGGTVFVIDSLSEQAVGLLQRRGEEVGRPAIIALDARSGAQKWSINSDVFGTWLGYSEAFDVLVEAGRRGGLRDLPDEPRDRIKAYGGDDGSVLWDRAMAYTGPIAIHGKTLLSAIYWHDSGNPHQMTVQQQGRRLHLLTGEDVMREDPLTGRDVPWTYWRTYGCGTANVSKHLVLFRSGAAGYADLEHDGGTGTLGGFRAGCTANLIAADGVLLAPDYTRTCSCAYQNQTSLGLIHMPTMDYWTVTRRVGRHVGRVRRMGINLNAPGNRRAADGMLWVHYPKYDPAQEALSPDIRISMEPETAEWFRTHSLLVDSSEGHNWVAASGGEGIHSITVENLEPALYTVQLHFVEPGTRQPGERVFDVLIQGNKVLEDFDVMASAGKANRAVVKTCEVEVSGELDVVFSSKGTSAPPVLCGIEFVAVEPTVVSRSNSPAACR